VDFVSTVENPLILSIETATRAGSVAVSRGIDILAERAGSADVSHSSTLLRDIENILEEAGVTLGEVEVFAAATGPGSFTGLRIGLATTKSFAATLMKPCVGVPTLFAIAHAAGVSQRTLALLPAGRGEVFAQMLAVDSSGDLTPLDAPAHLAPDRLLDKVKAIRNLRWAGEGARLYLEAISAAAHSEGILFCDETLSHQPERNCEHRWTLAASSEKLAADVAALALVRVRSNELIKPEHLQALYVRASDAEIKVENKNG
jgi:tRNA threonylcarbamoyladenosine biosynthesis protein TsaB